MHGLIRRTSADNRKWNERPSAGIIRPDAVATGRDALQDALQDALLRDPALHVSTSGSLLRCESAQCSWTGATADLNAMKVPPV